MVHNNLNLGYCQIVTKNLLLLAENGAALQVRRGSLCVRGADRTETLYPARVHGLRVIIMAGRGGSLTDEAIRWAAREGVALYLMCRSGEAFSVVGETMETDHRRLALAIRQRQFRAASDPRRRLEIARKIVAAKLRMLELHPADAVAFRAEIADARSVLDLMAAEARAGGAYFLRFRGIKMRFRDDVPEHWRIFIVRSAPALKGLIGTSKARNAATPIGAMLNYVYAVALGQCTRAVIGIGMDPCFGFLHVPRQGRLSLSYDVLELHRADLTSAVFDHVRRNVFTGSAFEQSQTGVVSLGPTVARDIAAIALRTATIPACERTVRRLLGWL